MSALPFDVQNAIAKQIGAVIKKDFQKEINDRFNIIKNELILEFLSHPVTQEIKAGPKSPNISGTLGGISNLFAFIGFEESDDPIDPILDLLNSIQINYIGNVDMGNKYDISLPTAADIFDSKITPMPWATGRSWAQGIETGISGLGYLLRRTYDPDPPKRRSGQALQSSVKIRGGKFKNTQYISALINKYKIRFDKLK